MMRTGLWLRSSSLKEAWPVTAWAKTKLPTPWMLFRAKPSTCTVSLTSRPPAGSLVNATARCCAPESLIPHAFMFKYTMVLLRTKALPICAAPGCPTSVDDRSSARSTQRSASPMNCATAMAWRVPILFPATLRCCKLFLCAVNAVNNAAHSGGLRRQCATSRTSSDAAASSLKKLHRAVVAAPRRSFFDKSRVRIIVQDKATTRGAADVDVRRFSRNRNAAKLGNAESPWLRHVPCTSPMP